KLVNRLESIDRKTIGQNRIRLTTQQFPGLGGGDFADGGENRRCVSGGALDGKARIDVVVPRRGVRIDIRQMAVKIRIVAGELSSEQRRVRGEDSRHRISQMGD